ncbi:MAG: ATP synthase F0 subunit B [Planctomycetota bacterium]|nr:MAG: ATP synthase F0 subunit B [Planctomycetota bacterium]
MDPLILAEGSTPALLDPHHGLVFWTAVCFALVALLLYKVAWGPLLTALEERENSISGAIDEAQSIRAEAEEIKARYEEQLEHARQDAQAIINEGEADKQRILQEARSKASREASEIRARAEREIELAKQKALAELKDSARDLAMAIASKVIAAEVDAKKHSAIIDEVIASYERG